MSIVDSYSSIVQSVGGLLNVLVCDLFKCMWATDAVYGDHLLDVYVEIKCQQSISVYVWSPNSNVVRCTMDYTLDFVY